MHDGGHPNAPQDADEFTGSYMESVVDMPSRYLAKDVSKDG